jgi:hypothetical protein
MATKIIVPLLIGAMNPVVRTSVERRYEAMLRELQFLLSCENENLKYLRNKGWSDERLQVLFVLNSIYQLCVGPLQSSGRVTAGLGGEFPILHGADVFGSSRAALVNGMAADFFFMAAELGFLRDWMTKNTCGELIYWVARHERNLDSV